MSWLPQSKITLERHDLAAHRRAFDRCRAPEFHEDRAAVSRTDPRNVVQPADRAYRTALRREHVGCVLPRPAFADPALSPGSGQRHACRTGRWRDDRVRKSRDGGKTPLDRRGRRRQFDGRLRHGRDEALDSRDPSRGRPAQRRSAHAGGNQPPRHGRHLRRASGPRRPMPTSTWPAKGCPNRRSTVSATSCSTRSR